MPTPLIIRLRYRTAGAHVHVRFFTAPAAGQTFALHGELVFGVPQWDLVRAAGEKAGIEFVPDDDEARP